MSTGVGRWAEMAAIIGRCTRIGGRIKRVARPMFGREPAHQSPAGRLGIIVHSTAGFVDPGFAGTITLEISNLNRLPVALYPGMRVCQLAFEQMTSPAEMPYNLKPNSKYQNQVLPEESRLSMDPEFLK